MGNDGGSIPTRRELVKEAAKALTSAQLKEAQTEQQEYAWSTDPLTRKSLAQPIVSDASGMLYNKDSIIEYLLKDEDADKAEMRKSGGIKGTTENGFAELGTFGDRVKGLKDVVEIKFASSEDAGESKGNKWVCPITGTQLGPGAKAVYIVPCGHVFAGSVIKEVAEKQCFTCNEPYAEIDVIPILPTTPVDFARLSLRMRTLKEKGLTHALRKATGSKKRKKGEQATWNGTTMNGTENSAFSRTDCLGAFKKKDARDKAACIPASNGIKNASTASLTRKVLEEQEFMNKKRKLAQNDNVNSLFSKSNNKANLGNSADYMTRGFSIGKK